MASNMRVGGLASGIDTQQIIKDLMRTERAPLNKLKQTKQLNEWKRDDYRTMNRLLKELDDFIFNGAAKQSNILKKKITSTDETKASAVAAGAPPNTTTTVAATQLAMASSWVSNSGPNFNLAKSSTDPNNSTSSPNDVRQLKFQLKLPGETTYKEVKIPIYDTDTEFDIIRKFNESDLGITAMKESVRVNPTTTPPVYENRLVFTNKVTGEGAEIKIANGASSTPDTTTTNFMTALGFTLNGGGVLNTDFGGQNAIVFVNGYEMQKTTNTFKVGDMNVTIKQEIDPASPVSITSKTDNDAIFDTVIKFMDKYNEIIGKITGELREDKYRDYKPLTEDEKEQLSDDEIKRWEEKAKSGTLKGDNTLSTVLAKMRLDLSGTVNGVNPDFAQLSSLGITTSKKYYDDNGKLILNPEKTGRDRLAGEERLKKAIEENPEAIYNLFMADGPTTQDKGLMRRLRDTLKDGMDKLTKIAGSETAVLNTYNIGKNIIQIDERIESWEDKLQRIEERYWRQYTAMEKAVQKANEQGAYLMQQFSSGK